MDSSRHPLEAMVVQNKPCVQSASNAGIVQKPEAPGKIEFEDQSDAPAPAVKLSGIDRPALLLNSQLKVAWQNTMAKDQIWHNAGAANNGTPTPGIFDLLFDPFFKRHVVNFSECLEFFISQLSACFTKNQLIECIQSMGEDRIAMVTSFVDNVDPADSRHTESVRCLHQELRNGKTRSFKVTATNFSEGLLLVFELLKKDNKIKREIYFKQRVEEIRRQPNSSKIPYILLAAQLNDAATLRTEMMPDEYRRLVSDLCQRCLPKVEQCGGIFGKHIESGFFSYFLMDHHRETSPLRLIESVFEIKELMVDLGREWKIRKDWLHDIKLNMGLHWEKGYVSTFNSSNGEVLTSFGVGLQVAGAISQLAQDGQIWATKALINQISTQVHRQLRFGILRPDSHRHQAFIRNGFACIKDLFGERQASASLEKELNLLPITQIFDLSGLTARQE